MVRIRTYKELKTGNIEEHIGKRELNVYLWKGGEVSLSYDENKEEGPYFVLDNENRKKLIKLLTSKRIKEKK